MGMFDFVKNAGSKIFGSDNTVNDEIEQGRQVTSFVQEMGLQVESFSATVTGETVLLKGSVADNTAREKIILAAGNVDGISKVDDQLTLATSSSQVATQPTARFYTVQSGDSLSKISKEFYGDPMKYTEIFEANKPMLADPDKIYPGQTLRIPTSAL